MEGDKIPATHSRAKMDMLYNEPSTKLKSVNRNGKQGEKIDDISRKN